MTTLERNGETPGWLDVDPRLGAASEQSLNQIVRLGMGQRTGYLACAAGRAPFRVGHNTFHDLSPQ
jgi:hypothetical protein